MGRGTPPPGRTRRLGAVPSRRGEAAAEHAHCPSSPPCPRPGPALPCLPCPLCKLYLLLTHISTPTSLYHTYVSASLVLCVPVFLFSTESSPSSRFVATARLGDFETSYFKDMGWRSFTVPTLLVCNRNHHHTVFVTHSPYYLCLHLLTVHTVKITILPLLNRSGMTVYYFW